ncbi:MAG: DUF799 family lipoprotein [Proteobacteria bacterium]|nr:DUF799 family lipoprotein [Pseudomonadota bacterium]
MKRYATIASLLFFVFFLNSCSYLQPKKIGNSDFHIWELAKNSPPVVAILPFENETQEPGIEDLVRKSFYSHFSVKPFQDIELAAVDETLHNITALQNTKFTSIAPSELGRVLKCDALVYGKVKEMTRFYIGVYSQLAVGAEVTIVDTKTGKTIWENTLATRFHDGDIPLNPLSIIPTSIKTGMNLRDTQKLRVVDDLCRNLAGLIPDPPNIPKAKPVDMELFYELQVASYRSNEKALASVEKLQNDGYRTILRNWKNEKGEDWYRLIVGPFMTKDDASTCKDKIEQESEFCPIIFKVERPKGM